MQKQESTRHQDKTHHITDPRTGRQGRDLENFINCKFRNFRSYEIQMKNTCLFIFEVMWIMSLYLMILI